jgi:predicted MFS family arabinose efflux permease
MKPSSPSSPWNVVAALAITQIVSWGTIFYGFSVLLSPIEQETGWSRTAVVSAFSLSVLVTGLCAAPVGALIDRFAGRAVMSAGSLLAAVLLGLMSRVQALLPFYALWAVLGVAAAMLLYEAAFTVIYATFTANVQNAIIALTLCAGFASTIFWPLTQALVGALGWRNTLLAMAGMNFAICLPLHLCLLPNRRTHSCPAGAVGTGSRNTKLAQALKTPAFWLLAVCFTANILAFAALSVHLIPLLQEKGFSAEQAVWLAALVGPMQVGGRLLQFVFARNFSSTNVAFGALAVLPLGLIALVFVTHGMWLGLLFVACYGASNGVMTIVRASLPAELFGREHYGAVNGALATPVIVTRAVGPSAAAFLWQRAGSYEPVIWTLAAFAVLALLALSLLRTDSPHTRRAGSHR